MEERGSKANFTIGSKKSEGAQQEPKVQGATKQSPRMHIRVCTYKCVYTDTDTHTDIRVWDAIEMCFGCARKRLDNDKVKTQTLKEKEKVDKRKRMTDGSAECGVRWRRGDDRWMSSTSFLAFVPSSWQNL